MEAGYDYLLLRRRLQRKFLKYTGIIVVVVGALLLAEHITATRPKLGPTWTT
jgi:hypothetical protein